MVIENLLLNSFTRVNEKTAEELLKPDELSILINAILSKKGGSLRPFKRGGFGRFNTNVIDASGDAVSLHDVKDSAGSNYILASITTKLRKSLAGTGTWSDVKTGLITGLKTRIASYGDEIFVTNGTDTPFVLRNAGFANIDNLEITEPDLQGVTATPNTGTSLDDAFYAYVFTYITTSGKESDSSHPIIVNPTGANKVVDFANLPVSADSRVTGRKVYRTEGGGSVFYYLASLDNIDTIWTDNLPDTDLDLSIIVYYKNVPTKIQYLAIHRERLLAANISRKNKNKVQKPFVNFETIVTLNGTGTIANGTYKYKYSLLLDDGSESVLSPYTTVILAGTNDTVQLTASSRGSGVSNTSPQGVVGWKFYRTTDGGSTYYWAGDGGAGTDAIHYFQDTIPDATLITQGTYPKSGTSENDITSYPSHVVFSEIGQPITIFAENFIPIYDDDGDAITGAFDDGAGFIVFKERSICKVYTDGSPINWQVYKLVDNIGCNEPNTLYKNGDEYFFVYNNRAYLFNSGGNQIKPISQLFETTFDLIDTFYSTTFLSAFNWYVVACLDASLAYRLLIYDVNVQTWYNFTISEAFEVIEKKHGASAGVLLIADGNNLVRYSPDAIVDNEDGVGNDQYSVQIRSKTFIFPDGITEGRARIIHFNYDKITSQDVVLTMTNPDNSQSKAETFTASSGWLREKKSTDVMTGDLKTFNKIYFNITGNGLSEFGALRLDYRPIRRGKAVGE